MLRQAKLVQMEAAYERLDICGTELHATCNLERNCLHYLTPLSLVTLPAFKQRALESGAWLALR